MKYLFVVQGEGRGHFTQALSLKNMLERNGHEVSAVMVGRSSKRSLPDFFTQKIGAEIIQFESPNFLPSAKGKKSPLLISILYNLFLLPNFFKSMLTIRKTIAEQKPDVVINFYELMCGFTYGLFNPETPMVSVAHQYYFLTPQFNYSGEDVFQYRLLNFYSRLTSLRATKVMALSFRAENDCYVDNITIVPPLLRQEVLTTEPRNGNYIHGYMLNSGFADELAAWSENNLNQPLHFFWDKKSAPKTDMLTPMLAMHQLSDSLFLHYMSGCKGYATTGGFESVCEAMYLQKPVLMVPTHIEQECNVQDAMRSGAGIGALDFELDKLLSFIPTYTKSMNFRYWANAAESIFLEELTSFDYAPSAIMATT